MTHLLVTACLVSHLGLAVDVVTVDSTVTITMFVESQEQQTVPYTTEFVLTISTVGSSESKWSFFVMTAPCTNGLEDPMPSVWRPLLCFCTSGVEAPADVSVPINGTLSTFNAPAWAVDGDLFHLTDLASTVLKHETMREPVSSRPEGVRADFG
jgi:hypothetical protein